mgnify:CR=1 FL=1
MQVQLAKTLLKLKKCLSLLVDFGSPALGYLIQYMPAHVVPRIQEALLLTFSSVILYNKSQQLNVGRLFRPYDGAYKEYNIPSGKRARLHSFYM